MTRPTTFSTFSAPTLLATVGQKATAMVPYDRVRITVHSDWVLVCGIRADGSRGGSVPTLAEVITGFPGSLFHGGGVFASAEEALAHAMTLPLLDPARTSTLTRPTLVSPADPNLGRVH